MGEHDAEIIGKLPTRCQDWFYNEATEDIRNAYFDCLRKIAEGVWPRDYPWVVEPEHSTHLIVVWFAPDHVYAFRKLYGANKVRGVYVGPEEGRPKPPWRGEGDPPETREDWPGPLY
jgi:hypothetical protein